MQIIELEVVARDGIEPSTRGLLHNREAGSLRAVDGLSIIAPSALATQVRIVPKPGPDRARQQHRRSKHAVQDRATQRRQ